MATFVVTFSYRTAAIKVHAMGCQHGTKTGDRNAWTVNGAKTAADAKRIVEQDEDADARGLSVDICPCAK